MHAYDAALSAVFSSFSHFAGVNLIILILRNPKHILRRINPVYLPAITTPVLVPHMGLKVPCSIRACVTSLHIADVAPLSLSPFQCLLRRPCRPFTLLLVDLRIAIVWSRAFSWWSGVGGSRVDGHGRRLVSFGPLPHFCLLEGLLIESRAWLSATPAWSQGKV